MSCLVLQCGTTTQGTTAGAGSSGVMGEEPDVASPRKQLQRRRGQGPDSDGEVSDQSLAALKGSSRRKDTALDPLASWFANHFVALQERGASPIFHSRAFVALQSRGLWLRPKA